MSSDDEIPEGKKRRLNEPENLVNNVDWFPVPIQRNLQVPSVEATIKKIKEVVENVKKSDFFISTEDYDELERMAATLWVKWFTVS